MNAFNDWRFIIVAAVPLVFIFIFLVRGFNHRGNFGDVFADFNVVEAFIQVVVSTLVLMLVWNMSVNARIGSYPEQIGGFITAKWSEDGSHEESETNCTGSGDNEVCITTYYTVYDTTWYLSNNTGKWWSKGKDWSRRTDRSGEDKHDARVPTEWANAYVGMPVSWSHDYKNYVAPLMSEENELTYKSFSEVLPDICPTYQRRIDDNTVQKIYASGFPEGSLVAQDIKSWNIYPGQFNVADPDSLTLEQVPLYGNTLFGFLGTNVQGDMYVYVMNSTATAYADMCMSKWQNGAKNAINVFIFGQENGGVYSPVDVVVKVGVDGTRKNSELDFENESERGNYYLKIDIRNQLLDHFNHGGGLNRESVLGIVSRNINSTFVRQEMEYYNGLKKFIKPTDGGIILLAFLSIIGNLIASTSLSNNDL